MTSRQASKDQHRLKEKIEKERIKKEAIKTVEGRENEEKEMEVVKNMMESLFVNVFSSLVCDVIDIAVVRRSNYHYFSNLSIASL